MIASLPEVTTGNEIHPAAAARQLLDVQLIYAEPDVEQYARAREVLAKYPHAERRTVPSHWMIPGLYGNEGAVENWIQIKRTILVLGTKKSISFRPNTRSSDFVAPSQANGCTMACAYCYVPRRKGFANPITVFVNIEQIMRAIERHAGRQPARRPEPDQLDPERWIYEIGENSDCSADAMVCDNTKDLIGLFARIPNAKATFATKFVNQAMLGFDPQGHTRIRFSLMPQPISTIVDVRTSRIEERVDAINDFVEAGYEVHLNFSPVILYDGWLEDWTALFERLDDTLTEKAKAQVAAEIIFLTHNDRLHEVNMGWHPKAEEYLWRPEIQETKFSQTGGKNVRYKRGLKGELVKTFCDMVNTKLPYCRIRYAF